MIIALLLSFIISFLGMILSIFPDVSIVQIPLIGPFVGTYLTMAVGYWNTFAGILPYMRIVSDMFLYVIIPFEMSLVLLKVFLGSRSPIAH